MRHGQFPDNLPVDAEFIETMSVGLCYALNHSRLMAGTPPAQSRFFRFGPFELDVRAGELRKHGIRIKLRQQPVQILLMLLDHPGEVVLREEIRFRLWPNNTVVEFDYGINAAIQKLRDGLGESADKPRYVETVARRGYRF